MVNKGIIHFLLCLLSPTSTRVVMWLRAVETTSIREALTRSGLWSHALCRRSVDWTQCAFEYFLDIVKFSLVVCNVLLEMALHFFFTNVQLFVCKENDTSCNVSSAELSKETTPIREHIRALTTQGLKEWDTYRAEL